MSPTMPALDVEYYKVISVVFLCLCFLKVSCGLVQTFVCVSTYSPFSVPVLQTYPLAPHTIIPLFGA